jgi:hypothetical protein
MHAEDENPSAGELGFDDSGRFNPIENRHTDIHQDDVRSVVFDRLDGSKSMSCLGNDLQARCFSKNAADGPSINQAVIGNNNTNRQSLHKGRPQEMVLPMVIYDNLWRATMGSMLYLAVPVRGIENFLIKERRRISPGQVPRYPQPVLDLLKSDSSVTCAGRGQPIAFSAFSRGLFKFDKPFENGITKKFPISLQLLTLNIVQP